MGAIHLIPPEHMQYLVNKLIKNPIDKARLAKACGTLDGRARALREVERAEPGTLERLAQLWTHKGGVAVHLWQARSFDGLQARDLVKRAKKALGEEISLGQRATFEGDLTKNKKPARMGWVDIDSDSARFGVVIRVDHNAKAEGYAVPYVTTPEVEIAIDLHRKKRIAEVFATQKNAQRAIEFLYKTVLGIEVPPESDPERDPFLVPFRFNEKDVRATERKLGMHPTELEGDDAEGELGTISMQGQRDGNRYESLKGKAKASAQIDAVNDKRGCALETTHADGFCEYFVTQFYLRSKHQHVRFKRTTSRPSMRKVLDQLLAVAVR